MLKIGLKNWIPDSSECELLTSGLSVKIAENWSLTTNSE
jgi:hypothetical protein